MLGDFSGTWWATLGKPSNPDILLIGKDISFHLDSDGYITAFNILTPGYYEISYFVSYRGSGGPIGIFDFFPTGSDSDGIVYQNSIINTSGDNQSCSISFMKRYTDNFPHRLYIVDTSSNTLVLEANTQSLGLAEGVTAYLSIKKIAELSSPFINQFDPLNPGVMKLTGENSLACDTSGEVEIAEPGYYEISYTAAMKGEGEAALICSPLLGRDYLLEGSTTSLKAESVRKSLSDFFLDRGTKIKLINLTDSSKGLMQGEVKLRKLREVEAFR